MAKEDDVVLIYFEDKPLSFARIEDILPDAKPNWYHVKLLLLQVPLQIVTWILRDAYINGEEFTMQGKRVRLESVVAPKTQEEPTSSVRENKAPKDRGKAEVISFGDRKKP
jgi:hypothetical protein